MSFTGKRAKDIWTQGQQAQAGAGSDSQLKQTSIKKLHYQLVIDRTSQLPQQYQLRITVKRQGQTIDELITITYTKWGKVTITTPDLK
jgi:phosphopantetheinyl transferase